MDASNIPINLPRDIFEKGPTWEEIADISDAMRKAPTVGDIVDFLNLALIPST